MKRIDRISAILIQLQSQRVVTAQAIAQNFNISERTVYRDIRSIEEAGVPLDSEAGVGYSIRKGFRLPPIMFSKDEATALLMGGKVMSKALDSYSYSNYKSALNKIKSILSDYDKDHLQHLEESIVYQPFRNQIEQNDHQNIMPTVQSSLSQGRSLEIDYYSPYTKRGAKREIEPIGLFRYGKNWHLIAFCKLRNDYRDFRFDRIKKIQLLNSHYCRYEKKKLKDYLHEMKSKFQLLSVKILFKNEVIQYVEDHKIQMGCINEVKTDEGTELEFLVIDLEYFSRLLLTYASGIKVISPDKLKTRLVELAQEISGHYLTPICTDT